MAVRVGGGAARGKRPASAHSAPVECSSSTPLRDRDGLSQSARSSYFSPKDGQPAPQPPSQVVRAAEGHAAKRGGLGSRRWADIRLAASLVCEKGVMLKIHGVEVCPLLPERAGRALLSSVL